jgi:(S)-citramalyl-CoA lyase
MRINNPATEQGREDLRVAEALAVAAIVLPKATSAAVELIDSTLPIVALIETAAGLRQAYTIASHPHVLALMLGSVDLALDLGLAGDRCNEALTYAEASLVFDARAANLGAPIHGVCTSISDDGLLRSEAARAKRIGFGAKACIHPVQLPIVHAAFAPDERELAWARRIVQACEAAASRGEGVFRIDGEMVDSPVIERAKRLLAQCG